MIGDSNMPNPGYRIPPGAGSSAGRGGDPSAGAGSATLEGGEGFFDAFANEVEDYANFHWRHMRKQEEVLMPLAERHLKEEDWREIDAAFQGNADPLIGVNVKQGFEQLFTRIVRLAPAPIGVGPEPSGRAD
jgi:hypothetical protein